MLKDTKYNIVPFTPKAKLPEMRQPKDLTEAADIDVEMAIEVASRFFQFDFSQVKFSGEARFCTDYQVPSDRGEDADFVTEVWCGGDCVRRAEFWETGVTGILYAEVEGAIKEALQQDFIGAILYAINTVLYAINTVRGMPPATPRPYKCKVDDWQLNFECNMFP